jgi:hypothetical protein
MIPLPLLTIIPSIFSWYQKKQEMQMRLYEIVWEATKEITKFLVRNRRVIFKWLMVLAILACVLLSYAYCASLERKIITLNDEKQQIQLKFNDYVNSIAKLAAEREAENKIKSEQGKKEVLSLVDAHKKTIAKIEKGYANEKTLANSKLNSLRDGLRLALERENSLRLPENDINGTISANDTSRSAARCDTIETAAKLCAADFRLWRDYALGQQKIIGVENE